MGWPHVDAMLAAMPAGQLDEWMAYHTLEPWGDDWERSSMQTTQLVNALRTIAAGLGGQKLDKKDLLEWDSLVPGRQAGKPNCEKLAGKAMESAFRGMCGGV